MIIAAAIKIKAANDIVIAGLRHSDCYETLYKLNPSLSLEAKKNGQIIEGFISNTSFSFFNREDAYIEALMCGQLSASVKAQKNSAKEKTLYSEDLY